MCIYIYECTYLCSSGYIVVPSQSLSQRFRKAFFATTQERRQRATLRKRACCERLCGMPCERLLLRGFGAPELIMIH